MPLSILYRDDRLIAVDKPAGHLVHPADEPSPGDLVTMKILRDQIGQQVHAIHRLDRPTCGVLLFATDKAAAKAASALFESRAVEKTYWAIVDGHPAADRWTTQKALRKTEDAPERSAETRFRVLQRLEGNLALIEAIPRTGRYHQIRRHLLHAGHPIVGDYRYAGRERSDALGERLGTGTRMLLQAKQLTLPHPITGEPLKIQSPTAPALRGALADSAPPVPCPPQ